MNNKWILQKHNLEKLLNDETSYEEIGRIYGVTGAYIKKVLKKMGFALSPRRIINPSEHFNKGCKNHTTCLNCGKTLSGERKNKKYCSNKCQNEHKSKKYIELWKSGDVKGVSSKYGISRYIRNYLFQKYNSKCQLCGWGETNKKTGCVPLEIHHIDGDYTNNKEENLQLLCPNCHSLTENYKRANKCGRRSRSM